MHSLTVKSKFKDYSVHFKSLEEVFKRIKDHTIVIDKNVYQLYKKYLTAEQQVKCLIYRCTEEHKSLQGAAELLNDFVQMGLKANAKVAVIGGGILQDVAGFACSIYCRGIEYTLIPTTLLAQCDSCVGGKTSINLEGAKNIVGTFYPPSEVLIATEFLDTLTESDILSGLGEVLKFALLQDTHEAIQAIQTVGGFTTLVYDSLKYKISILDLDEFDKGERKFLNFGHTFGHALESTSDYRIPHGTGVLIGALVANNVSTELGLLSQDKNLAMSKKIGMFIRHQSVIPQWFDFEKLLKLVQLDKKNTGTINMVLLTDTTPRIVEINNIDILKKAVEAVYETIRLRN